MNRSRLTPKAKQYRKRQLERLGLDKDKILDILDYEFDLQLGRYPGVPLRGQKYAEGGSVDPLKGLSNADKRRILRLGMESFSSLLDNEKAAFKIMRENQIRGVPNFSRSSVKNYKSGGVVRGHGAAIKGTKFKGVF